MTKSKFIEQLQLDATVIAQKLQNLPNYESTYFDRGYNSGGADPIIDADASNYGLTASIIGSYVTLMQQLANFRNNAAVVTGDYDSTLNKMRNDI